MLHDLEPGAVRATFHYEPDAATLQVTVGTSEAVAPGIFHKLTGALTEPGPGDSFGRRFIRWPTGWSWIASRSAIRTTPASRRPIASARSTRHSSSRSAGQRQTAAFRRTWNSGRAPQDVRPASRRSASTPTTAHSDRYTIFDVFAYDRTGLLYAMTRAFFELGCSVWRAKISTYLDQVLDVFYVTDQENKKIEEQGRLDAIREAAAGGD